VAAKAQGLSGQGRPDEKPPVDQKPPPWKQDEKELREAELREREAELREAELREREAELREREVKYAGRGVWVQSLVGVCAVVATLIAAVVAYAAVKAVDTTADGIERQTNEDRLSTAIAAIGGDDAAERVGGFSLLRRHARDQLSVANGDGGDDEDRLEAYSLYTVSLDVLENYLRSPPSPPTELSEAAPEGAPARRGYGIPRISSDAEYAANEVRAMMDLKADVQQLGMTSGSPGIDLSKAQLYGKFWRGIDFAWLGGGHVFTGIDLRGANLRDSIWGDWRTTLADPAGGSDLTGAFLQCADLVNARLIRTTLTGTDFRGADLSGADLTGAVGLTQEQLDGATWSDKTEGLEGFTQTPGTPRGKDLRTCLNNEAYWVQ